MKDDRLYLHHMLERCRRVARFTAAGREAFLASKAAKRVSSETRSRLAHLDWRAICGMRDVLIHDYISVDLDEVWNVSSLQIPGVAMSGDAARTSACATLVGDGAERRFQGRV